MENSLSLLTALCFTLYMVLMGAVGPWGQAPWYNRWLPVLILVVVMILGIAGVKPFCGLGGARRCG